MEEKDIAIVAQIVLFGILPMTALILAIAVHVRKRMRVDAEEDAELERDRLAAIIRDNR